MAKKLNEALRRAQENYDARNAAADIIRVSVRVPKKDREDIVAIAADMRAGTFTGWDS